MKKIEPVDQCIKKEQIIISKVAVQDKKSSLITETIAADPKNLACKKTGQIVKHRTNIREILLSSNATPIRRYAGKGYMCCYCEEQYHAPAALKKHTLEAHKDVSEAFFLTRSSIIHYVIKLDITSLRCNICKININTLEELMDHLRTEHSKKIHTDINNHIIPFKFDTEKLQCFMCNRSFEKFNVMFEHMNVHYRNYVCEVCDAGFVNHGGLKSHASTHKTGSFGCEYCPKVFDTKVKMRLHARYRHTHTGRIYKCVYCAETFNDYWTKENHLSSAHGVRTVTSKCQACNKVFRDKKFLGIHVKRDHLMHRPHQCSKCDMKFFSLNELKDHMVKHTGIRPHQCTVCLKSFGRKSTLKEHMRIHEDVRRFKCEHCEQAFVQKCSWKRHMRSKHGDTLS